MIETVGERPPIHIEDEVARGVADIEALLRLEAIITSDVDASLGVNGVAAETAKLRSAVGDTSECDVAPEADLPENLAREKYNRSLRAYRALGRLARTGQLNTEKGRAARENVRRDLVTSLAEMFENGEEFRGGFEITDIYDYDVVDGQVQFMTADGPKPIRQIIEDGAAVSAAAALTDPLMIPQAERDAADVWNALRVDGIASGKAGAINTRLAISRDLGDIIKVGSPYRNLYYGKGYREGLSFIQLYYANGNKVTTGTFSVDGVSDEILTKVLTGRGAVMPAGGNRHDSVKHGVELNLSSKSEAVQFALDVRAECYALMHDKRDRRSASQFVNERAEEIDSYIDALCVPLAISIDAELKQRAVHDFIDSLLRKTDNMDSGVVSSLRGIRASEGFTDDDGRRMAGVILYAIAEVLYERAKSFALDQPLPKGGNPVRIAANGQPVAVGQIIHQLSNGVHTGIEAGRSHGGSCPGEIMLGGKPKDGQDPTNPQGAYGGLEGEDKESAATDKYGKSMFKCPHADCKRENFREYNQLREECQHCKKKIPRCGPSGPESGGQETAAIVWLPGSSENPAAKKSLFDLAA